MMFKHMHIIERPKKQYYILGLKFIFFLSGPFKLSMMDSLLNISEIQQELKSQKSEELSYSQFLIYFVKTFRFDKPRMFTAMVKKVTYLFFLQKKKYA